MGYDIVGDVHGYADELEVLLQKMGYQENDGSYGHSSRKAIFVGDLIDRGPKQKRVIEIVRSMVDGGNALIVMGNHEFNAICYHMTDANGLPLREHSEKNQGQHQAFLHEYPLGSKEAEDVIDWFKSMPLFVQVDSLNIVHACWNQKQIEVIQEATDGKNRLDDEQFMLSSKKGSDLYQSVEVLLKGAEVTLPSGHSFMDKGGDERREVRIRWWDEAPSTYRDAALVGSEMIERIPEVPLDTGVYDFAEGPNDPTFIGHYWLGGSPAIQSDLVACVDYSVADEMSSERKLMAYRWDGEGQLSSAKFCWTELVKNS